MYKIPGLGGGCYFGSYIPTLLPTASSLILYQTVVKGDSGTKTTANALCIQICTHKVALAATVGRGPIGM